ncbi:CSN-associated deubiquitinating enzyme Ubp12 [Ceratobasidium sp. 395]|nr:CSN-associated deubiquitinating enzyme Ubp12 [Ceratobasidium sp. 395]
MAGWRSLGADSVTLATDADAQVNTDDVSCHSTWRQERVLGVVVSGKEFGSGCAAGNDYVLSGLYRHTINLDDIINSSGALLCYLYPNDGSPTASTSKPIDRGYSAWGFGGGNLSSSYAPREFKQTLGRFAPALSGYQQRDDTQKFLGLLLDGLHEDLNRVLKKPYVEKPGWPETGGGRDVEARLGRETWEGYKPRNDSIIVDFFQGMYKGTLVCPECAKVQSIQRHVIHYVPWESIGPALAVQIEVLKDSSYGYLKKLFRR